MKFGADQKPRESGGEKQSFSDCVAIAYLHNEQAPQTCSHYTKATKEVDFYVIKNLRNSLRGLLYNAQAPQTWAHYTNNDLSY